MCCIQYTRYVTHALSMPTHTNTRRNTQLHPTPPHTHAHAHAHTHTHTHQSVTESRTNQGLLLHCIPFHYLVLLHPSLSILITITINCTTTNVFQPSPTTAISFCRFI